MVAHKRPDPIRTRLNSEDRMKFEAICRAENITETELARRAILRLIDSYDQKAELAADNRLAETIEKMVGQQKKDTERLAKMIARTMMDVGIVNQVLYKRAPEGERKALWTSAQKSAVDRLKQKRVGGDPEATELVPNALGGQT